MKEYSTAQVARIVGVHTFTLQRWLLQGKMKDPHKVRVGTADAGIWTDRDVEKVQK